MRIEKIRKAGDALGREGMSKMALKEIADFDGSYKGVMELCGKLSVIAKMATCDDYWHEKVNIGIRHQEWEAEKVIDGAEK